MIESYAMLHRIYSLSTLSRHTRFASFSIQLMAWFISTRCRMYSNLNDAQFLIIWPTAGAATSSASVNKNLYDDDDDDEMSCLLSGSWCHRENVNLHKTEKRSSGRACREYSIFLEAAIVGKLSPHQSGEHRKANINKHKLVECLVLTSSKLR